MKYKIIIEDEDPSFFLYDITLDGYLRVTQSINRIKRNIKTFEIRVDFNTTNTSVLKLGDNNVIITHKYPTGEMHQFLITSDTDRSACPEELIEILDHGFNMLGVITLSDLMNELKVLSKS